MVSAAAASKHGGKKRVAAQSRAKTERGHSSGEETNSLSTPQCVVTTAGRKATEWSELPDQENIFCVNPKKLV